MWVCDHNDQKSSLNCKHNSRNTLYSQNKTNKQENQTTNRKEGKTLLLKSGQHDPHLPQKPHYTTLDLSQKSEKRQFSVRTVELCKL